VHNKNTRAPDLAHSCMDIWFHTINISMHDCNVTSWVFGNTQVVKP